MRTLFARLLVILVFTGSAGIANATLVTINGIEWQQPDSFDSSSWNDISAVCDYISGACSGSLHAIDLSGWTWASPDDLNGMFNAYFSGIPGAPIWVDMGPGPDSQTVDPNVWTAKFSGSGIQTTWTGIQVVGWPEAGGVVFTRVWAGWLRGEVAGYPDRGYLGGITDFDFTYGTFNPYFRDDEIYSGSQQVRTLELEGFGGWFYRNPAATGIPIPGTPLLLGVGLACLGWGRRNKA